MSFTAINRQFLTAADFAAWLATLPPPSWARSSTYHNTFSPTEAEWHGLATMHGMQSHYESLGWSSAPHCFLALHCPNPAHAGVWVMTPPTEKGIHAGVCNADHFGVEVVGDFHQHPPSAAQQHLLVETVAALHRWAGLGPHLDAHRDCMAGRTCPGDAFYALKPILVQRLTAALIPDPWEAWGTIDRPEGLAQTFAIPQLWLKNKATLGACVRGERYDVPGKVSRALFQKGEIRYLAARNIAEVLPYPPGVSL